MRGIPSRVSLLVPAGVCLAIAIAMAVQVMNPLREDAYWPVLADAPTLSEASSQAEVYLQDQPLLDVASDGELRAGPGHIPVSPEELRVRINDYERVTRAQLMLFAAALGAGIALLVTGILLPGRRPALKLAELEPSP